ncbi:MAG: LPS export ABC transporter periplasmic protein LptC [Proteobacteria bacterium]|nr:LPS export ABC transporter periplasmic protein LptC [Pseudomonadota bacterium]MBU1736793.1 LPS export ABC transporter periplasmic protein LptC [Pseudomonadota bacterium]
MNLNRNLVWVLPLLLLIGAPLWWQPVGTILAPRGDFSAPPLPSQEQLKRFAMEGVTLSHCRDGKHEFTLNSARVTSNGNDDSLQLLEVRATITGTSDPTIITSGEAYYHTGREILTMLDRVRITMPDHQEIRTEALRYLAKYRKVKTAEDVFLNGSGVEVRGSTMFYDLVNGALRVGGRVVVDLQ